MHSKRIPAIIIKGDPSAAMIHAAALGLTWNSLLLLLPIGCLASR